MPLRRRVLRVSPMFFLYSFSSSTLSGNCPSLDVFNLHTLDTIVGDLVAFFNQLNNDGLKKSEKQSILQRKVLAKSLVSVELPEDELAEYIEDLLSTKNPAYTLIKGILKTYYKLVYCPDYIQTNLLA